MQSFSEALCSRLCCKKYKTKRTQKSRSVHAEHDRTMKIVKEGRADENGIVMEHVRKRYGQTLAVNSLTLSIDRGNIIFKFSAFEFNVREMYRYLFWNAGHERIWKNDRF